MTISSCLGTMQRSKKNAFRCCQRRSITSCWFDCSQSHTHLLNTLFAVQKKERNIFSDKRFFSKGDLQNILSSGPDPLSANELLVVCCATLIASIVIPPIYLECCEDNHRSIWESKLDFKRAFYHQYRWRGAELGTWPIRSDNAGKTSRLSTSNSLVWAQRTRNVLSLKDSTRTRDCLQYHRPFYPTSMWRHSVAGSSRILTALRIGQENVAT
jgi:hypothetical protein